MAAKDPLIRQLAAIQAGHASALARTPEEHAAAMAIAREAQHQALIAEADPDGSLPPEERDRRVAHLRSARMAELARKAVIARRARRDAQQQNQADADLDALAAAMDAA